MIFIYPLCQFSLFMMTRSFEGKANRKLELPTLCILPFCSGCAGRLQLSVSAKIINFLQICSWEPTPQITGGQLWTMWIRGVVVHTHHHHMVMTNTKTKTKTLITGLEEVLHYSVTRLLTQR